MLRWWDGTAWTEHVAPVQQPYAAQRPGSVPTTPDGQPLSGWWWRVLAYVIDGFVLTVVTNIVSLPSQVGMQRDLRDLEDEMQRRLDANPDDTGALGDFYRGLVDLLHDHAVALVVPGLVVALLYFAVLLRWKGATLGMLATGLRVRLRERPGRLPWSSIGVRVLVQYAVNIALLVALLAGSGVVLVLVAVVGGIFQVLNYLWPLWDAKRQALHDKAARTNVVRVR
jgi:uncharacterized RDD family membrane protein YckC